MKYYCENSVRHFTDIFPLRDLFKVVILYMMSHGAPCFHHDAYIITVGDVDVDGLLSPLNAPVLVG